jgi:glycine/D-amino acid oxidase-like deaminating enzyme
VVVGAGIVGASIAWHLARSGAQVTIIDAGEPGGVATRNSWAWINASWGNPEPYYRLRIQAMDDWRRLEGDMPGLHVAWTGSLNWELPAEELQAFADRHLAWGYDIRCVGRAEARRIEPGLADPPDLAVFAPREGAVEPVAVTHQLLAAAQDLGATVLANNPVTSVALHAGRVVGVDCKQGRVAADQVVLAAGAGSLGIAATIGLSLPITNPPALLVVTRPHAPVLNGLVMSPAVQLRQMPDGRFAAAASYDGAEDAVDRVLDSARRLLRSGSSLALDFHAVGRRPIPEDRLPLVGRADGVDGLYVAVTHSGVTLAPAIGRFSADEILTGRRHPLLQPFGLDR